MMMKRTLTILLFLAVGAFSYGQQIAVVSPGGATSIYTSLDNAIQEADAGSTLYLSGGVFQLSEETKIKKKLTFIGIGHRSDNDNAGSYTTVMGNLHFEGGSDYSSVLGIYLSLIFIGTSENPVNSVLVRFVNIHSVQVLNSECQSILINQSYLRHQSSGGGSTIHFSNNVIFSLFNIKAGIVEHNIFVPESFYPALLGVAYSQIRNNILINLKGVQTFNCTIDNNMVREPWGENSVVITKYEDEFEGIYNGVNPTFDYHLKSSSAGKGKATSGTDIGIYGGSGFNDKALPLGPRIDKKIIGDITDANGNLPVLIEVKVDN